MINMNDKRTTICTYTQLMCNSIFEVNVSAILREMTNTMQMNRYTTTTNGKNSKLWSNTNEEESSEQCNRIIIRKGTRNSKKRRKVVVGSREGQKRRWRGEDAKRVMQSFVSMFYEYYYTVIPYLICLAFVNYYLYYLLFTLSLMGKYRFLFVDPMPQSIKNVNKFPICMHSYYIAWGIMSIIVGAVDRV